MSFAKVSLPANLSVEALARELYSHGFWNEEDFATQYHNMRNLARELRHFGSRPAWQTQTAYDNQLQALKFALNAVHQQVSEHFYKWACWPGEHLNKPEAQGHIWYLLSSRIDLERTSKQYEVREVMQLGRARPKFWSCHGFDAEAELAVGVLSDDNAVHVGINDRGEFSEYYGKWVAEYVGPASGLSDWAQAQGIILQRLDLQSSTVHAWQVPQ